jgi:branched-chain amino acid transport system permease protein
MDLSSQILQCLLSGISVGATYALIALGFSIIYNATTIVNFAQGEFVMIGGMMAAYLSRTFGLPLIFCFLIAVAVGMTVGILLELLALRQARNATGISLIVITVGASILLRGIAMLVWGKDTYRLPSFSGDEPINIAGATIIPQELWIIGIAVLVVVLLWIFFEKTFYGKAMLAGSINKVAAALVGINVKSSVTFAFAISAALGALAGVIMAPKTMTGYDCGIMLGLKGFEAAILGGFGSSAGAILGGFLLGIIERLTGGFISSAYMDSVGLLVMLMVLYIKPSGLLGHKVDEKV